MIDPRVLHQDEHVLVLWKPAGMPVQPDRTGDRSLLDGARELAPAAELVHRIDRPVSGAVLFACVPAARDPLNRSFRERAVEKVYWAIVHGAVANGTTWRDRLVEDGRARRARPARAEEEGREAITHVRVLAHGDRYSLVELRPEQGLFHQLRAQCAAAGHPIKGDVKYGARRGEKDRSIALHARTLAFDHPFTGARLRIEAPPPDAQPWRNLCERAGIGT